MNNFKCLAISLIAVALLGCNQGSQQTTNPKAETAYGLRALDSTWPDLEQLRFNSRVSLTEKNFYIVLDNSKSMDSAKCIGSGRSKLTVAKSALSLFVEKLPRTANVGIASFNAEGLNEYLPLQRNYSTATLSAVASIANMGKNVLSSGVYHGFTVLEKQAIKQLGYGEYHLIVITDNETSAKSDLNKHITLTVNDSAIALHSFSICGDNTHPMNKPGVSYKSVYGQDPLAAALRGILSNVSAETSSFISL